MNNKTITLARDLVANSVNGTEQEQGLARNSIRAALADPVPPAYRACGKCGKPTACGKMICEECCYEPLPVPPAGGEVEVRAAFDAWFIHDRALDPQTDTTLIDGPFEPWRAWKACADQYSAHVTRLQAEVERLKALSVTSVMLDVIPGDGSGLEVYAKSVGEVEECLGQMGAHVEDLQSDKVNLQAELAKARECIDHVMGLLRADKSTHAQHAIILYQGAPSNEFNQSAPIAQEFPPKQCRQRIAAEGKPYPRSSCAVCGQFSPKWRECDAMIEASSGKQK